MDGMNQGCNKQAHGRGKRGSALLIVLGFLSFMMISAVSFAIYMRIERQASSNYRHSTTARHMLNGALFRAIDEIDSELRLPAAGGKTMPCKFPTNWVGRVRPSAVADGKFNDLNTRVLSLESLGFIPGVLVNDVRRNANPHKDDKTKNTTDDETLNWHGAKWRTFNNMDGSAVGRYAYLCINVSDMLDVNLCRASGRDSVSNRVSISHLFDSDTARQAFDDNVKADGKYLNLQDFYASLYQRKDQTLGSPFHKFIDPKNTSASPDGDFNEADNHVLITGSRALPEPLSTAASDTPLNLYGKGPGDIDDVFITTLDRALPNVSIPASTKQHVKDMVQDYLDEDSVPRNLGAPCVEMVPMISQITFVPMGGNINKIVTQEIDENKTKNVLEIGAPSMPFGFMIVEVVWPFKNFQARGINLNSFKVRVHAFVKVLCNGNDRNALTSEFMGPPQPMMHYYTLAPSEESVNLSAAAGAPDDRSADINKFYAMANVRLPDFQQSIDLIDSDGTPLGPFNAGQFISVATVVFAQVIDSSGNVVDQAPLLGDRQGGPGNIQVTDFIQTLYFQSDRVILASDPMSVDLQYQWTALETPDPRLNHKAANWVLWQASSVNDNPQQPGLNYSTEQLLGKDGRDSDIFMSVSDTGYFQSPGELGFIMRPFAFSPGGSAVDLSDPARQAEDTPHMFRTIRLYDHGGSTANQRRDDIYDHFYLASPDGTLIGARVNPLSDLSDVLEAAIAKTPFNYWISGRMAALAHDPQGAEYRRLSQETYDSYESTDKGNRTHFEKAQWNAFVDVWHHHLLREAQTAKIGGKTVAESWQVQMRDVYGLHETMGWYTGNPDTIFKSGASHNAAYPLHEIDRKMLYSYSLDSFCDRQQLFLYVIRAEVTSPTLFSSASEARSLAGGRAVALVWRDPYPTGYTKDRTPESYNGVSQGYDFDIDRISPWYQHNLNDRRTMGRNNTELNTSDVPRRDSYHEHKILFFKQLDK